MRYLNLITIIIITSSLFFSCSRVPITGRRQLNLLKESEMISMSSKSYAQFLGEHKTIPMIKGNDGALMVRKVGQKMSTAIEIFLKKRGKGSRVANFKWEFNYVNEPIVNAWCMPGGKIVVYAGIMPIAQDETGLAVVMGHEIAHAIARHGNERMSQQMALQTGGVTLGVAMGTQPELTQNLFNQSFGLASGLGTLAFSRGNESEADQMGLVFMAISGYNPSAAPDFWERMLKLSKGNKPMEILSTHPSDETRIKKLETFLPEAMTYYKK